MKRIIFSLILLGIFASAFATEGDVPPIGFNPIDYLQDAILIIVAGIAIAMGYQFAWVAMRKLLKWSYTAMEGSDKRVENDDGETEQEYFAKQQKEKDDWDQYFREGGKL